MLHYLTPRHSPAIASCIGRLGATKKYLGYVRYCCLWTMNWDVKRSSRDLFKVLFRNLRGRAREDHGKPESG